MTFDRNLALRFAKRNLSVILAMFALLWAASRFRLVQTHEPNFFFAPGPHYWNFTAQDFSAIHLGMIDLFDLLRTAFYYSMVVLIGWPLTEFLFEKKGRSIFTQIGAAFLPGYLMVVAINRVVMMFLPACWATFLIYAILAALGGRVAYLHNKKNQFPGFTASRKDWVLSLVGLAITLFVCLIWQIQVGSGHMFGDSTLSHFSRFILKNQLPILLEGRAPFPLLDQQYDEMLFNLPLFLSQKGQLNFQTSFWFLTAVARISTACLAYTLLYFYIGKRSAALALTATLYLLIGSGSIIPTSYVPLLEGQNPISHVLHIGRMISAIIPWYFIALFRSQTRSRSLSLVELFLLGMGLVGTTVNNFIFGVPIILAMVECAPTKSESSPPAKYENLLFGLVLAGPLVTYSLNHSRHRGADGIFLIASGVLGIGYPLYLSRERLFARWQSGWKALAISPLLGAFLSGSVVSLFCMGNVFSILAVPFVERHLRHWLWPAAWKIPFLRRPAVSDSAFYNPSLFQFVGNTSDARHADSLRNYLGYFGLTTLFFWIAMKAFNFHSRTRPRDEDSGLFLRAFFLFAGLFSLSLFLLDFTQLGVGGYWIRIRLIEIPLAACLMTGFIVLYRYLEGAALKLVLAATLIWSVIPFLSAPFLNQWVANLHYFFDTLVGG